MQIRTLLFLSSQQHFMPGAFRILCCVRVTLRPISDCTVTICTNCKYVILEQRYSMKFTRRLFFSCPLMILGNHKLSTVTFPFLFVLNLFLIKNVSKKFFSFQNTQIGHGAHLASCSKLNGVLFRMNNFKTYR